MSNSKPGAQNTALSRVSAQVDELLGIFRHVPPSPTLNHAVRYLSTWGGTDKVLMITQYGSQIVMPLLAALHRLRHRLQLTKQTESNIVPKIYNLYAVVADARILFRIWGLLPILQWMISMERTPPPTKLLQQLERLQGWSMVLYCPMEALAYLAMHKVITLSNETQNKLWLWGCRFWAFYVVLQFAHLVEDNRLLRARAKALQQSRGPATTDEKAVAAEPPTETRRMWAELRERKDMLLSQLWVNIGYLPLTLHWSVEGGFLSNGWVGVFGTIAGMAGARMNWKATA